MCRTANGHGITHAEDRAVTVEEGEPAGVAGVDERLGDGPDRRLVELSEEPAPGVATEVGRRHG